MLLAWTDDFLIIMRRDLSQWVFTTSVATTLCRLDQTWTYQGLTVFWRKLTDPSVRHQLPAIVRVDSKTWKTLLCNFTKGFLPPSVCKLKMVSERWFSRVRWSDGLGWWTQRVPILIHQTFTSSKYHRVVLVPGHVSTREIRKEYLQERPLHRISSIYFFFYFFYLIVSINHTKENTKQNNAIN